MSSVLKLIFKDSVNNKNMTWTIKDPKTGLTKVQAAMVMNYALSNDAIKIGTETSPNIDASDAYIYTTNKIELE